MTVARSRRILEDELWRQRLATNRAVPGNISHLPLPLNLWGLAVKRADGSCILQLMLGAIGLAISIPSLTEIAVPLRRLPVVSAPVTMVVTQISPEMSNLERCLSSCDPIAVPSAQAPNVSQTALSGTHWIVNAPNRDHDARTYLLETATAARRDGPKAQGSETNTALWLNDPTSIGSTSPAQGIRATPEREKDSPVVLD